MQRNRIIALASTIVVHVVILLILGTIALTRQPVKPNTESGIFIQVGNIDEASGTFEPYAPQNTPEQIAVKENIPLNDAPNTLTQSIEESVAIDSIKQQEKKREEERLLAQEQARQKETQNLISSTMQSAFGAGSDSEGSRGDATTGNGVQGNIAGNSATGLTQGTAGWGGFSLNGRKCINLPKPSYRSNEEGKVVVDITVDKNGKVVAASIKAGSNTNETLRSAALVAAKKAQFDKSENSVQKGTITYYFKQK